MIVCALVGPAYNHDDGILALEEQEIVDWWLQFIRVFLDPFWKINWRRQHQEKLKKEREKKCKEGKWKKMDGFIWMMIDANQVICDSSAWQSWSDNVHERSNFVSLRWMNNWICNLWVYYCESETEEGGWASLELTLRACRWWESFIVSEIMHWHTGISLYWSSLMTFSALMICLWNEMLPSGMHLHTTKSTAWSWMINTICSHHI